MTKFHKKKTRKQQKREASSSLFNKILLSIPLKVIKQEDDDKTSDYMPLHSFLMRLSFYCRD